MLHVHARCMSLPCCMFLSILYAYVHAACPRHAECLCPCCMPVSMMHAPVRMPLSMLHAHVPSSCPSSYCMTLKMQHGHNMDMPHGHGHAAWTWTSGLYWSFILTIRQLIHHKKFRKQKFKPIQANMSPRMGRYHQDLKITAPWWTRTWTSSMYIICPCQCRIKMGHSACPGPCCVSRSILRAHTHVECLCLYARSCLLLDHIHDACPCSYYKSLSMLHDHVPGACSCHTASHVHAACLCPYWM